MVAIGGVPIVLHIMNIYAAHGFTDFILCLGYKGEMIREYFLNFAHFTNDIELNIARGTIRQLNDVASLDYTIALVDTGLSASSGQRVMSAARYVTEEHFMVTYGDGVSDVDVVDLVAYHQRQRGRHGTCATITGVHPSSKYGQVLTDEANVLTRFDEKPMLDGYINGGFMVFQREALAFLRPGESLEQGLARMTESGKVSLYQHDGFWHGMDTLKDVQYLNHIWNESKPWAVAQSSPLRVSVASS